MPENTPADVQRVEGGRFAPGVSGNPGGRPKGLDEVRRLAAEKGPAALRTLASIADNEEAPPAARVAAAVAILDRWVGKPSQPLEHAGEGGGALEIRIVRETREP